VVNNVVGVECAGSFTGALELSGTGGTPEYSYSLSGSAPQISGSYSELTNGVYVVTLTDNSGCTATAEVELPFTFQVPLVDFNTVVSGEAVLFDNTSEFGDTYLWDFGDGTTSTDENPVHIYASPGYYTVTLSVTNGCGTRTRTRAINTIMIGIEDAASTQFSVFPNPTAGILNITNASDISGSIGIEITSVSGQRVMQMSQNGVFANGKITIDATALGQGMYYLTVQTSEGRSVMRFNVIR
jgi:PKD repeat protein